MSGLRVVKINVDEKPVDHTLSNGFEGMREIVCGHVTTFSIRLRTSEGVEKRYLIACNEDAEYMNPPLKPNFTVGASFILGNVCITKMGEGDFASLNDDDVKLILRTLLTFDVLRHIYA